MAVNDAPMVHWTRLMDGSEPNSPSPRSGHAMTLLAPTQSVLMFGGSNGKLFFDDFYVLEPADYASLESTHSTRHGKQKAKAKMRRTSTEARLSQASQESATEKKEEPTLVWKKLVTTHARLKTARDLSSVDSEGNTPSPRGIGTTPPRSSGKTKAKSPTPTMDMRVDAPRDYHTMHYVPSSNEKQLGFRVLVVGNSVMSSDDDDEGDRGTSQDPPVFDMEEMRIDEVRVKQPQLAAQWIVRTVQSMWKPHARNGHCSALIGDQLFCFGGKNPTVTEFYNDFFYFDVGLSQWREQVSTGNIPSPRAFADMTAIPARDQLFLFGGCNNKRQFAGMYMYDVQHNRWDKIQSIGDKPDSRLNHSLTQVSSEHLVVFGGRKHTSRRNDVFMYDVSAMAWKRLGSHMSRNRIQTTGESQSESQSTVDPQVALTQSSVSSALGTTTKHHPPGRTAHSAVLLGTLGAIETKETKRIIVFGGYAGSHTWLNDLFLLEVDPNSLMPRDQSSQGDRSSSSLELSVACGLSSASNTSSSTQRSSSRSSIEGALLDITNIEQSEMTSAAPTTQAVVCPKPGYIPAAVAARRRRAAEIESKRGTPTSQKKQKPNETAEDTSASQSQQSESKDHGASAVPGTSTFSSADAVGLQTMMIQLLQYQQEMHGDISQLTSLVRDGKPDALRDAFTAHQVIVQKQIEALENKLDAMTKRNETNANKVEVLEREKQTLREQLVASETEVYVYKKTVEDTIPKLRTQIYEAIEQAGRVQNNATHLLQSKISSIHDMLEEIRHLSGERTENDDSPPKQGIFPDDPSSPPVSRHPLTPNVLYPQTFVRDLEKKLDDTVQEKTKLQEEVEKLKADNRDYEKRLHRAQLAIISPSSPKNEEAKGK